METGLAVSPSVADIFGEESVYHQLLELERELDYRISRKQNQILDATFNITRLKRTLLVSVVEKLENVDAVEPDNPPSWTLRVSASLEAVGRQGKTIPHPLAHFIKSIIIEFGSGGSGNVVEWIKGPHNLDTDAVEVKRPFTNSDSEVPVRILLTLDYQPEQFRLSQELSQVLLMEQCTRPQVVTGIIQYIKTQHLQESEEKRVCVCDNNLKRLFDCDTLPFQEIPSRLNKHLLPVEAHELHYTINLKNDVSENASVWDFEVEIEDGGGSNSKIRPNAFPTIGSLAREINLVEQRMADAERTLKTFVFHERVLREFSKDPLLCIRRLMNAQRVDKEMALDEAPITMDQVYKASSFDDAEVEKALLSYLAMTSNK